MKISFTVLMVCLLLLTSCNKADPVVTTDILGSELLSDLNGHWVGTNETSFGFFDWFAFDFRPISSSHSHSIYEGATNQNIINSVFIGELAGEQKIFARNGGWLGTQYRATYFVLDVAELEANERYYRLVDAVGGENRAYIEFNFLQDSMHFNAYKDNSGSLDKPLLHMSFKGANRNSNYSSEAIERFSFPQVNPEVNFGSAFTNLVDPDSALYLEESDDPFPKSMHGHLSDVTVKINRDSESENKRLLLFISKEALVSSSGFANLENIDNSVIRTIDIQNLEDSYTATYLHPDQYYFTVFLDNDNNSIPSSGDISSFSILKEINPELLENVEVRIETIIQ